MIKIAIIDNSQTKTPTQLQNCAAALQVQANEHFGALYPLGYSYGLAQEITVRAVTSQSEIEPSDWVMILMHPDPAVQGALGYHDETPAGLPVMKIFPELDAQDGAAWEVTCSHELLETLANPRLGRTVQSPVDGKIWAYEIADAVEQDTYNIHVNGVDVPVSNFVLPPYFEPSQSGHEKFDYLGLLTRPLEIREGGYGQYLQPDGNWKQILTTSMRNYRKVKILSESSRVNRIKKKHLLKG